MIRIFFTGAALAAAVGLSLTATSHAALALNAPPATVPATEPAPKAARYITLWYPLPPSTAGKGVVEFYNEATVRKEVSGSYFCAEGFSGGYFGIQDRSDKKVVIFSVWDTGKKVQEPDIAAPANQVKVISLGDGVHYGRFGNEGTGAHSDMAYDWQLGKTYQFFIRATPKEKSTQYEGWFRDPSSRAGWKHIATFEAPDGGKKLKGLYSFLEDFRRDYKSATEIRRYELSNGWVKPSAHADWVPLLKMRFATQKAGGGVTGNLDAGVIGDHFYMQNGGDTVQTMALGSTTTRPASPGAKPPDVPTTQPSE